MASEAQASAAAARPEQRRRATEQELSWERRLGPIVGIAGILSAILFVIALWIRASALRSSSSDANKVLETAHKHQSDVYLSAVTQTIGTLLVAVVLVYFLRATRHRRPDTPRFVEWLAVVGTLAVAVMGFLAQHELVRAANEFVNTKPPTGVSPRITNPQAYLHAVENLDPKKRAEDISRAHFGGGLQAALLVSNFLLGIPLILTALWAGRAGLLSRFWRVLGIIVGILYCVPFLGGGGGFIQIPWLAAVGLIALDKWPGRRGDAWTTGEPVPWLSQAELRAMAQREQRQSTPPPEPAPEQEGANGAPSASRSSRKRKRKQGRKH